MTIPLYCIPLENWIAFIRMLYGLTSIKKHYYFKIRQSRLYVACPIFVKQKYVHVYIYTHTVAE